MTSEAVGILEHFWDDRLVVMFFEFVGLHHVAESCMDMGVKLSLFYIPFYSFEMKDKSFTFLIELCLKFIYSFR